MHESHTGQLLPRLEAGGAVLAQFAEHCLDCKVCRCTESPATARAPVPGIAAASSTCTRVSSCTPQCHEFDRETLHSMLSCNACAPVKHQAVLTAVTSGATEPDDTGGCGAAAPHQRPAVKDQPSPRPAFRLPPGDPRFWVTYLPWLYWQRSSECGWLVNGQCPPEFARCQR